MHHTRCTYTKEIIIVLLTISNLSLLYLHYRKYTTDCFSTFKHVEDVADMQSYRNIAIMKQLLLETYDATKKSCGAAVSMHERNNLAGTSVLDMACLIAGNRDLIWVTMDRVKTDLYAQYVMFQAVAQAEGIREFEGVSFRPSGERNALLFVKAWLATQKEIKQHGANSYLLGLLLGYDTDDIAFFYQRSSFLDHAAPTAIPPFTYPEFSAELKQQFKHYLEHEWINSGDRDAFQEDKRYALEWIEDQSHYSIGELYKHIEELKEHHA
jgi:hypothetical protein